MGGHKICAARGVCCLMEGTRRIMHPCVDGSIYLYVSYIYCDPRGREAAPHPTTLPYIYMAAPRPESSKAPKLIYPTLNVARNLEAKLKDKTVFN